MAEHLAALSGLCAWSRPAETEERISQYLATKNIPDGSMEHAEFLTQLARAQGLQKKFDVANETLAKAKAAVDAFEESLDDENEEAILAARRVRVRHLLERGRVINTSGNPEGSIMSFQTAVQISRLSEPLVQYQVDALHMLGIADKERRQEWTLKAIAVAEKSKDPAANAWLASLYNNQGWRAHDDGDFDTALELFQKALVERKKKGDAETIRIAEWCVGRCRRSRGEMEEALEIMERLSEEGVYVCEERAILYSLKEGKKDLAREFAGKALAKFQEGDVSPERLQVLRDILNA